MSAIVLQIIKPVVKRMAVGFLKDKNISQKLDSKVKKKVQRLAQTNIGADLCVKRTTLIQDIPFTGYDFYLQRFMNPKEGDFIYPLSDYARSYTSGTMSRPKMYLLPKTGINENIKRTALSLFYISTFDGQNYNFSFGDVIYANIPGGGFTSGFVRDDIKKKQSSFVRVVPENSDSMTYKQKVDYFVNNHRDINIAYMSITTLLDEVVPNVEENVQLKSFITNEISARPLKERIREACGTYPMAVYGSTETVFPALPSVEYPGAFFFDWRVVYPEFLPEDKAVTPDINTIEDPPETVKLMDVQLGEKYQLIATPFYNDMTRFVTSDMFECIALSDDMLKINVPIFVYYARCDQLIVLHNYTRINEEELMTILEEKKIPFVDFIVRKELHGSKEYLVMYIELAEDVPRDEIVKKMHEGLYGFDKDWRDLSDFMNFIPLKVKLLQKGTFKKYLHNKEGMPRIARIGMHDEQIQQFFDLEGLIE